MLVKREMYSINTFSLPCSVVTVMKSIGKLAKNKQLGDKVPLMGACRLLTKKWYRAIFGFNFFGNCAGIV